MKKFIRTISLALVLVMSLGMFAACSGEEAADNVFDEMALTDILAVVTNGVDIQTATMAEPLSADNFEYFAFAPYAEGYEGLTADAMMNAVPHSLVLVKVPEGTDAAAVAETIKTNANPAKWLCAEAETVHVEQRGRVILLVMSFADVANGVQANFVNYTGAAE